VTPWNIWVYFYKDFQFTKFIDLEIILILFPQQFICKYPLWPLNHFTNYELLTCYKLNIFSFAKKQVDIWVNVCELPNLEKSLLITLQVIFALLPFKLEISRYIVYLWTQQYSGEIDRRNISFIIFTIYQINWWSW
jgi:hypothetical protein